MKTLLKRLFTLLMLLILIAGAIAIWKREALTRLLAVNSLFSKEKIVSNFSNMNTMFLSTGIETDDTRLSTLPQGTPAQMPYQFPRWAQDRAVTAIVALKGGEIRYEDYFLGTRDTDLRISWSVAKSFLSALMGIIVEQGKIQSIDDPVIKYAPTLRGSAYETATIRNVLQMSSGVTFNEDYLDFNSDINKMGRVLALGGSMDGFAAGLKDMDAPAGERWQYVSIDTHVLGMVIRGATGRDIPELLEEYVIQPLGLEQAPYYVTDGYGVAFVLGGLNLRTRDYARFGQMILQDGQWQGSQIVPADWIAQSTVPSAKTPTGAFKYGMQWWMAPDAPTGEFMARGVYGQYIYINKPLNVVIALNGADRGFRQNGVSLEVVHMLRDIAKGL